MVVPTLEAVAAGGYVNVGLIATSSTIRSGVFERELEKLNPDMRLKSVAAPLLVPLIEEGGDKYAPDVLRDCLAPLADVEALVLGCTHYPKYKALAREILPGAKIISQDEILPQSLADYLARHPEIESRLGRGGQRSFSLTDETPGYSAAAARLFGRLVELDRVVV